MNRFKLLILLLISISFTSFNTDSDTPGCGDWKVDSEIIKQDNGMFTLKIKVTGNDNKLQYVFYEKDGDIVSQNFDSPEVKDLLKGTYGCTIVEKGGCKETKFIELK